MHPHVLDAEVGALAHRRFGGLGPGCDHDRVDAAGDRAQVVVAAVAFDLVGVRVDGEDLVAAVTKALVDDVASVILGLPETPVTATRLLARNSDAASLIFCICVSLRIGLTGTPSHVRPRERHDRMAPGPREHQGSTRTAPVGTTSSAPVDLSRPPGEARRPSRTATSARGPRGRACGSG